MSDLVKPAVTVFKTLISNYKRTSYCGIYSCK